ncbi:hypothetical protein A3Q35_16120 [Aeribacillus pallidus]|nr:hypothetical protein A3Q35_16120 [Aeribacillus pallidus]
MLGGRIILRWRSSGKSIIFIRNAVASNTLVKKLAGLLTVLWGTKTILIVILLVFTMLNK